ncbi:PorP/SprF family type IX secretion system membrane protein [Fulvivirga maritima]|uniref:PorP/SprF family type IX secretion system membrane protein n=1 Tax=Fulvivirga maritima TaxID=2904247 RepID=UPI001F234A6E|nr:PorP/SprF family type IX secretion system membrane protein [Fulvivirga maritima]UII29147.1 PorP/SprF family type IX secretion system membrane protein [Fulvivirga maritima]
MILKYGLLFSMMLLLRVGSAQDPFFSQFYNAPLVLNPALTGISFGKIRANINYKNYLSDFDELRTYSFSADMSLMEADRNPDFAGVGLMVLQDDAGGYLTNTKMMFSYAYHNAIGREARHYIAMGLQVGIDRFSIDYSDLSTQSQWVPMQGYNAQLANGESFDTDASTALDFQVGALYYTFLPNDAVLFAGVAGFHLSEPDRSLMGQEAPLSRKYLVHGGGKFPVSNKLNVVPTMVYFYQNKMSVFNPGVSLEYQVFKANRYSGQKSTAISMGGWIRNTDACILGLSLEYGEFNAGISYDLILSSMSSVSRDGGLEISMSYNFNKKFKTRTKLITNPSPRL